MAERLSTGFVNAVNQTGSVKATMQDSVIGIFSGTQPANADATEGAGSLLMLITVDGGAFTGGSATNGLEMGTSTDGVLSKAAGETWKGTGLAAASTGTTATWFRWYANAYTTGASTSAVRIDGAIGTTSAYEMQMSNTSIVEDVEAIVNTFTYTTVKY